MSNADLMIFMGDIVAHPRRIAGPTRLVADVVVQGVVHAAEGFPQRGCAAFGFSAAGRPGGGGKGCLGLTDFP